MEILHLIQNSLTDAIHLGGTVIAKDHLEDPGMKNMMMLRSESDVISLISPYSSKLLEHMGSIGASRLFLTGVSVRQLGRYEGTITKIAESHAVVMVMDWKKDPEEQYAAFTDIGAVGIPLMGVNDGWSRFKWIYNMIDRKKWNLRGKNWFVGLSNPAELAVYPQKFINAVNQTFRGVLTESCYIDSAFGVRYSPGIGNVTQIVIAQDPQPYRCSQQHTLFQLNEQMMKDFAMGKNGADLIRMFDSRLKGDDKWRA